MNLLYKAPFCGANALSSTALLILLSSGFSLPTAAASAAAQSADAVGDEGLPVILIESTRLPHIDQDTLRNVQTLTPNDSVIEHSSIAEALNGLVVALPSGNDGQLYTMFTRGASSTRTRFMLDGFRIGSVSAGGANLNTLAPAHIGRVEVLKGESSGLYGSDAMGGTISVSSRTPTLEGEQAAFDAETSFAPRYATRTAHVGFSGYASQLPVAIRIDASHAASAGYSLVTANNPFGVLPQDNDNDGYERTNFSTQVRVQPSNNHAIDWIFHNHSINADIDFGNRSQLQQSLYGFKGKHTLAPATELTWRLGRSTDNNVYDSGFSLSHYQSHMDQSSLQVNQQLGKGQGFALVEQIIERLQSDTAYDNTKRTTRAIGIGYRLAPAPIGGEISLRHERTSTDHSHTTFSGRLGARLNSNWLLSVGGGTAFREPTFNDLYYPGFSNDKLTPEKSRNLEALVRYTEGNFSLQGTAFRSNYRGLIALNDAFMPENLDRARIQGIELDAHFTHGSWKGRVHTTWQNTLDENENTRLARRPQRFGGATLEHFSEHLITATEIQWVGQRWDNSSNTVNSPGFITINLKAEYPFSGKGKGWSSFIQANNLLNKRYEPVLGYAAPGAQVLIGMRYRPITD